MTPPRRSSSSTTSTRRRSATERGLLVPNVKDADRLGVPDLARAIADAVDAARTGRVTTEQMTGGAMTITNIGVFGVDSGTPSWPPGESAIVCLGAVAERPWAVGHGHLAVRQVTTLGLSSTVKSRFASVVVDANFWREIGSPRDWIELPERLYRVCESHGLPPSAG